MRHALLMLGLAGCGVDLDFTSDATSIRATAADGKTTVSICAGPSGLLSCNADEGFLVTVGAKSAPAEEPFLSFGTLQAIFDDALEGTAITVTRDRDGASATVTLPATFSLSATATTVTRRSGVTLSWTPSGTGERMSWIAESTCDGTSSATYGDDEKDDGQLTIPGSKLPEVKGASCPLGIRLRRERRGSMLGYEKGSSITGMQERGLGLTLLP